MPTKFYMMCYWAGPADNYMGVYLYKVNKTEDGCKKHNCLLLKYFQYL